MHERQIVAEAGAVALRAHPPQHAVAIDRRVDRLLRPVEVVPVDGPHERRQRGAQVARLAARPARRRRREQEDAVRAVEHPLGERAHERGRLLGRQHLRELEARGPVEQHEVLRLHGDGDHAAAHARPAHAPGGELVAPPDGAGATLESDDVARGGAGAAPGALHDQVHGVAVEVVAEEPLVAGERVLPEHGAAAEVAAGHDGVAAIAAGRLGAVNDDAGADHGARGDLGGLRPDEARGAEIVRRQPRPPGPLEHEDGQVLPGGVGRLLPRRARLAERGAHVGGVAGALEGADRAPGRCGEPSRERELPGTDGHLVPR